MDGFWGVRPGVCVDCECASVFFSYKTNNEKQTGKPLGGGEERGISKLRFISAVCPLGCTHNPGVAFRSFGSPARGAGHVRPVRCRRVFRPPNYRVINPPKPFCGRNTSEQINGVLNRKIYRRNLQPR